MTSQPEGEARSDAAGRRDSFDLVSVVIPVLDTARTLGEQLEALSVQSYRETWEVVVVDNGSSDGTDELALSWSDRLPRLRLVYALERQSLSHARNVGSRVAEGDFLAFCDGDDVVEPGWLEALVDVGKSCDVVGGRLDWVSLNSPLARAWRPPPADDDLPVSLGFLTYAVGANCGVRAEVVRALGGWREELTVCGDDIDFSWRAQLASYKLCYAPEAVVRYRYRDDAKATARQFYNYGRAQPVRYKQYRKYGIPPNDWKWAIREWMLIVLHSTDLFRSDERKGIWMRKAAYRLGRLSGSLREGVLYL